MKNLQKSFVLTLALLASTAAWSIPMNASDQFMMQCGDACVPETNRARGLSDIDYMLKDALRTFGSPETANMRTSGGGWGAWWSGWSNDNGTWSWNGWTWNGPGNGWTYSSNDDDDDIDDGMDDDDNGGIPEPGPLALLGLGLVLLSLRRKLV